MTRAEKIHKLSNAIRDYRGAFHADSGIWIRTPKIAAAARVQQWMGNLGIFTSENWRAVCEFRNVNEFREWLKGIQ